jgi:hypothetical protein
MKEFFVATASFAAPFVSDHGHQFVESESPREALEKVAAEYRHPAGLYAANCYTSADAFHKGETPLARWLCNHEQEKQRLTANLPSYSYRGNGPGDFDIGGVRHTVGDPKGGSVVA